MSTITIVMLLVYLVAFGGGGIYMISKSMNGGKSGAIEGNPKDLGRDSDLSSQQSECP